MYVNPAVPSVLDTATIEEHAARIAWPMTEVTSG
jgi:hypothetical protein